MCAAVTHVVEVCGQAVADLLELGEAVGSLLLPFLFDVTVGGHGGGGVLDALIHRPLALNQLHVDRRRCRPLLLHRNTLWSQHGCAIMFDASILI